jgi:hypothetical protein
VRRKLATATFVRPTRVRICLVTVLFAGVSMSGHEAWKLILPDAVISDSNSAKVQAGSAVVEVLPARDREVAVFGVVKVGIDRERLLSWVRQVQDLQRSTYIPRARRFSDPPTLDDVGDVLSMIGTSTTWANAIRASAA